MATPDRLNAVESELGQIAEEEGPFLMAAILCERVLQEKDNVVSVIRLIDQITVGTLNPATPQEIAGAVVVAPYSCAFLVVFKGGRVGSEHLAQVIAHAPDGTAHEFAPLPFVIGSLIEGSVPGQNLVMQLQLVLSHEGTYWFEVRLDGRRVTATPFRVVFASVPMQPRGGT